MMDDKEKVMEHLKDHQTYPASKENLMETCNSLEDFSEEDKKLMEMLPSKTYNSADEVMTALESAGM